MRRSYILNLSYQRPNRLCCILTKIKKIYLFDPWNTLAILSSTTPDIISDPILIR